MFRSSGAYTPVLAPAWSADKGLTQGFVWTQCSPFAARGYNYTPSALYYFTAQNLSLALV